MTQISDANLLVIGGGGLIGSHGVDQLAAAGAACFTALDNFVGGAPSNLAAAQESFRARIGWREGLRTVARSSAGMH
jgi:UDP-glucose 4-epimerase